MLEYLMKITEVTEKNLVQLQNLLSDRLSDVLGDRMTALVKQLQEKARTEGMVEGQEKDLTEDMDMMAKAIARKLLMQKTSSAESVAHMTDLPLSVVITIQKDMQGRR